MRGRTGSAMVELSNRTRVDTYVSGAQLKEIEQGAEKKATEAPMNADQRR